MRISLAQICILVSSSLCTLSISLADKPTLAAYISSIASHRTEVFTLGAFTIIELPGLTPYLSALNNNDRDLIISTYFSGHDAPKTMSLEKLKSLGYKGDRPIYEVLYDIYGINIDGPKPFVDEMNSIEQELIHKKMMKLFEQYGFKNFDKIIMELRWIEKIVDVYATKTSRERSEELGFRPEKFAAETYLAKNLGDPRGALVARWLEQHTKNICALKILSLH